MKPKTKKRLLILSGIISVLVVAYFLGPKPNYEKVDGKFEPSKIAIQTLDKTFEKENAATKNLKEGCDKAVFWHNDSIHKTEYAVVFLHGFSACAFEGYPIVNDFAKAFGCNLYVHRFPQHGLNDPESFKTITPKMWVESAQEALNIGANIGKKLIVMSSSTGGTLGTYLAAENPDLIHAQFLYSPNFQIASPIAGLVNNHWGLPLLRQAEGGDYHYIKDMSEEAMPYWTTTYRIEGLVALQDLIEQTMTNATFEKIDSPIFVGHYYKNEEEKDNIVSIDRMKEFYELIQTPKDKKRIVPFAEVGGHVITNQYQKGGLEDVREATYTFAEEVLGMTKIE
ncbi:MAG: alpha/beta hydrolase [Saprospiraceae bacterium]